MAHRRVRFEEAEWDVWDVRPDIRPHRLGGDLENGWLCFQCGPERRRLHPIPSGWDNLEDDDLHTLFDRAIPVKPAKASARPRNDVERDLATFRHQGRSD